MPVAEQEPRSLQVLARAALLRHGLFLFPSRAPQTILSQINLLMFPEKFSYTHPWTIVFRMTEAQHPST